MRILAAFDLVPIGGQLTIILHYRDLAVAVDQSFMVVAFDRGTALFTAKGFGVKWSGELRQLAKMYPTMTTGYRNDEETQFFGQV